MSGVRFWIFNTMPLKNRSVCVLISGSDNRLDNFIRLLLNSPLESHWIRGLKLTAKFRNVYVWANWKKITIKSKRLTSVSSSTACYSLWHRRKATLPRKKQSSAAWQAGWALLYPRQSCFSSVSKTVVLILAWNYYTGTAFTAFQWHLASIWVGERTQHP